MFSYYFRLGLRSLRRNMVLTGLMIAAIGVGIGACMTALTVFRAMSGDPIPQKSSRLFAPQIDNWGPDKHNGGAPDRLESQLSYIDVMGLMKAHAAKRQSGMLAALLSLRPADPAQKPTKVVVRAAFTDFFPMFDVPFKYGGPWSAADDEAHAAVVVLTKDMNDKLFGGSNSVGKTVRLGNEPYRVSGVLDEWRVLPRFYDLAIRPFGDGDSIFMPFTRAIEKQTGSIGSNTCSGDVEPGWEGRLRSDCLWLQFWVELPTQADVQRYRAFLNNYAAEQQKIGRFHWPPHTQLRDVTEWLRYRDVVPSEVRILILLSFGFLLVCLMNAMGLMLAKIMGRAGDIGVRRALGASRAAIFAQCLIESAVVGLAGAILGLLLTALGLGAARALLSKDFVALAHLDWADTGIAVLLAIGATVLAGLYPTWRAAHVQPAWQLKAQ
ncbi:MAG TPA: ABC transporter permease [Steroidobacteraceae bacterium]|jgi:putative ABC transport system permease protein|nr:ABC transporter permease [Steroidobacteraceae bacterium]